MLKALNFGWIVCVKRPGVLEVHRKIGNVGYHSHTQRETGELEPTTMATFSLAPLDETCQVTWRKLGLGCVPPQSFSITVQSTKVSLLEASGWRCSSNLGDERRNKEIDTRIGNVYAVLRELYRSVFTKWELRNTTLFRSSPIRTTVCFGTSWCYLFVCTLFFSFGLFA